MEWLKSLLEVALRPLRSISRLVALDRPESVKISGSAMSSMDTVMKV